MTHHIEKVPPQVIAESNVSLGRSAALFLLAGPSAISKLTLHTAEGHVYETSATERRHWSSLIKKSSA